MKEFLEALYLKYDVRREYFTVGLPVAVAFLLVAASLLTGFAALPGQEKKAEVSDRQKAYEEFLKQMEGEESGESTGVTLPVTSEEQQPEAKPVGIDHVLVIVTLVAITPYALDVTLEKRRKRRKEELYCEFLFKLSELMRGGLDPIKSVRELSKTDLGILTPHVRLAATALAYGKSFEEAMRAMTRTLKSELIARYTLLVVEASYSGGSTADLILKASEDMRSLIGIEREKEGNLAQYTFIFYFAQGIIFFIVLTLTTSLLPFLQDLGAVSFLGKGNQLKDLDFTAGFFHLVMVNAFFGGLIIGKISEGEARHGLKHSAVLMAAGYVACVTLLIPAAQGPPPGEVTIKVISGAGQKGYPGLPLPEEVVVAVLDKEGKPRENAEGRFSIGPSGAVKPGVPVGAPDGLRSPPPRASPKSPTR
ncbi:MAG: type II secretion system F family protein, partial [Methanolinea sp.]